MEIVYNQDWFIKQQLKQTTQLKNTSDLPKATLKPGVETTLNLLTTKIQNGNRVIKACMVAKR